MRGKVLRANFLKSLSHESAVCLSSGEGKLKYLRFFAELAGTPECTLNSPKNTDKKLP